jgi:diketogulonate reductase-like aldo/keto reductase
LVEAVLSKRRSLGNTGETISAIALGTWGIRNENDAFTTLVKGVELGLNTIDTAEMYGSGKAEELVGRVVKHVGRDSVFLITKMLPDRLKSRYDVLKHGRAALRRLGVDEVDLYLIHWPNPTLSIQEQVKNFESLIDEGLTRYIGVSNFDESELVEAINSTKKADIVLNQVHYSVLRKEIEETLLPTALKHHVTIQAYTPLERGEVLRHPKLVEISTRINKPVVQIALNYVIREPYLAAVVKTENVKHLEEIAQTLEWGLTPDLIEVLRKL